MPESGTSSDGQEGGTEGGGSEGSNTELPPGDMTFPEGNPDGQPEGEQSGAAGGGEMMPEAEEGPGGGWETSNQLPDPSAGDSDGGGDSEEEDEESGGGGGAGDEAMQEVLGELDGEILNERNAENSRVNEELADGGLQETETEDAGTGDQDEDVDGSDEVAESEQEASGMGEAEDPVLPGTLDSAVDTPDAKDKNVIARQLEEAALAEEDPEVKEKLWEEYETYVDGLK